MGSKISNLAKILLMSVAVSASTLSHPTFLFSEGEAIANPPPQKTQVVYPEPFIPSKIKLSFDKFKDFSAWQLIRQGTAYLDPFNIQYNYHGDVVKVKYHLGNVDNTGLYLSTIKEYKINGGPWISPSIHSRDFVSDKIHVYIHLLQGKVTVEYKSGKQLVDKVYDNQGKDKNGNYIIVLP